MDTFAGSSYIAFAEWRGASVLAAFSLIISFFVSLAISISPVVELISNNTEILGISILQVLISGVLILNLIS